MYIEIREIHIKLCR